MYDSGEGVPQDPVHAFAWYMVALANGYEDDKGVADKLVLKPEELAKAKALSSQISKRIESNVKASGWTRTTPQSPLK